MLVSCKWVVFRCQSFKEFGFSPQYVEAAFAEHPPFDWGCLLSFFATHCQSLATIFTVTSTYSEASIYRRKRQDLHTFIPRVLFAVFVHSSVLTVIPEGVSFSGLYGLSSCLWWLLDPFTVWSNNFFNTVIGSKGDV